MFNSCPESPLSLITSDNIVETADQFVIMNSSFSSFSSPRLLALALHREEGVTLDEWEEMFDDVWYQNVTNYSGNNVYLFQDFPVLGEILLMVQKSQGQPPGMHEIPSK